MTAKEYEAEILRLHAFTLQLAHHLADAAEVLAKLASGYKITRCANESAHSGTFPSPPH
jgi:hypothetical protein